MRAGHLEIGVKIERRFFNFEIRILKMPRPPPLPPNSGKSMDWRGNQVKLAESDPELRKHASEKVKKAKLKAKSGT